MRNRRMMLGLAVVAAVVTSLVAGPVVRAGSSDNAKYTIVVLKFEGPNRAGRAKKRVEELKAGTGLKDLWIINEEFVTTVYYGKYKTVESLEDKDESDRAKRDLAKLLEVTYNGERPFRGAFFMPIPLPDPEANPAWDLKNAKGVYSLQIAAYKDNPERKQAAVDSVKEARAMGLEAYYFHGATTSSVLLGAFPAEALKEINSEAKARPDQQIISLPFKPKDMPDEVKNADGTTSKIVEHRVEVTDPTLAALMQKYPTHVVNGVDQMLPTGKPAPSFIVDIREVRKQSLLSGGDMAGGMGSQDDGPPGSDQLVPKKSTPGAGKLKSVDY